MDSAHLTPSQEDYLEAVYRISEEKKAARAKDIADRLNVRASSVTAALRTLAALELVHYAPYDLITLLAGGQMGAVHGSCWCGSKGANDLFPLPGCVCSVKRRLRMMNIITHEKLN